MLRQSGYLKAPSRAVMWGVSEVVLHCEGHSGECKRLWHTTPLPLMCVILRQWKEGTAELDIWVCLFKQQVRLWVFMGYTFQFIYCVFPKMLRTDFSKETTLDFFVLLPSKQMLAFIYFITVYKFVCRDFDFKLINDVKETKLSSHVLSTISWCFPHQQIHIILPSPVAHI